jgi:hypothetical protein
LGNDFRFYTCTEWANLGASYPIIDDRNTAIWSLFGNGAVPRNIIIDSEGIVRYNSIGFNETAITSLLDELFAGPSDTNPGQQPSTSRLVLNYPNPFNSGTNIHFQMEEVGDVNVTIYDSKGNMVKTFFRNNLAKGDQNLTWYGLDESGNILPSGTYIIRLETEQFVASQKALLLK